MLLDVENLAEILDTLGIDIVSQTAQDFIAYCPFHSNRDSPALNISKDHPYAWRCWNPSCGRSGSILGLVEECGKMGPLQSARFLAGFQPQGLNIESILKKKILGYDKPETELNEEILANCKVDYENPGELQYLLNRGFTIETLRHFEIGYSRKKQRITIPVRDENGKLVGISGRALHDWQSNKYRENDGFKKGKYLFNLNNAKRYGEVIVVEGPLDAMMVHQAGYPGVVATLGSSFSEPKVKLLQNHAASIIIFTDNDEAGRKLGREVDIACRNKTVHWAKYLTEKKDPGEMDAQEIMEALDNKTSRIQDYLKNLLQK